MNWRKDVKHTPRAYWFEMIAEVRICWNRPIRLAAWALYYYVACVISYVAQSLVWAMFAPTWAEPSWLVFHALGLPTILILIPLQWFFSIRLNGHRSTLEETRHTNWRNN